MSGSKDRSHLKYVERRLLRKIWKDPINTRKYVSKIKRKIISPGFTNDKKMKKMDIIVR